MPRFTLIARLTCVGLVVIAGARAQDAASRPRFEVASIRLNTSNDPASWNDLSGANVVFRNYTFGSILLTAFMVDRLNLEAPAWLYDQRFDITARVPDEKASLDQRRQMLQALLMDRFGLVVHHEAKTRSGFALVVAKNGPKIQPVEDVGGHNNDNRPGKIQRLRTTIEDFASAVADILRQPVVDETHLAGRYNVVLTYTPDGGPGTPAEASGGPSIFTALEEQLGLKLEPRKLPVDILVVDRCEKLPTEN